MDLTQEDVNRLYKQKFVTVIEASKLIGVARQQIWFLIKNKKLHPVRIGIDKMINTVELRNYAMATKEKFLNKVAKIRFPNNF